MSILEKDVPVDRDALNHVAAALDIEVAEDASDEQAVATMRKAFEKRLEGVAKDDWVLCPACGEVTDDADEIDRCPFCGDEGVEEEDAEAAAADEDSEEEPDEEEPSRDLADTEEGDDEGPQEPPTADLGAESPPAPAEGTDLAEMLDREKTTIRKAQHNMAESGYELGLSLRRIHEKELFRAEGHKTFKAFVGTIGISYEMAYNLMTLVTKFDRETFLEVGRKKLTIVARADEDKREELLGKAKKGASSKELGEEGKSKKKDKTPKKEKKDGKTPPSKESPDQITLLGKAGARPQTLPFRDRKTGEQIDKWKPESYVEIELSREVVAFAALKTDDNGEPAALTLAYRRREDVQTPTTKSTKGAQSNGKKTDKKDDKTAGGKRKAGTKKKTGTRKKKTTTKKSTTKKKASGGKGRKRKTADA